MCMCVYIYIYIYIYISRSCMYIYRGFHKGFDLSKGPFYGACIGVLKGLKGC